MTTIDKPELILCDSEGCDKAYHASCVNLDIDALPSTWYCPSCTSSEQNELYGGLDLSSVPEQPLICRETTASGYRGVTRHKIAANGTQGL